MSASARKTYLGDGAYADIDTGGSLVLTAENGIMATDTVVLERDVLIALLDFLFEHCRVFMDQQTRRRLRGGE